MSGISGQMSFSSVQVLGNGLLTFGGESYLFLDGIRGYVSDTLQVDHLIFGSEKSEGFVKKSNTINNVRKLCPLEFLEVKKTGILY